MTEKKKRKQQHNDWAWSNKTLEGTLEKQENTGEHQLYTNAL